jgi:hypothetical protein
MIKPITWSIFDRDGSYLGQYTAFAPETAFSQYMEVNGNPVAVHELHSRSVAPDIEQVTYKESDFLLRPAA